MSLRNEIREASRYESGVQFDLIKTPMGDGSYVWDVDVKTSTSKIRFSMPDDEQAWDLFSYLTHQTKIVEVSTDDELPDPYPDSVEWGPVDLLKIK